MARSQSGHTAFDRGLPHRAMAPPIFQGRRETASRAVLWSAYRHPNSILRAYRPRRGDSTFETSRIKIAWTGPSQPPLQSGDHETATSIPWPGPMLATRGYMGLPDAVLERGRQADAPVNDGQFVRWEQPQPFGCGALRPGGTRCASKS
jgi:hypothetical protein